jgi:AcrR family transcriptional regulator
MARTRDASAGYREKIIQGASKLIIEKGVASTSLADIAEEVGISKGTLYYYYPSKGELIFDISERHMEYITDKIFSWIEESGQGVAPDEVLWLVFKTITTSETRGHIHVYLLQEALTGNASLRERFTQEYERWASLIEQGLHKIIPGRTDHGIAARVILSSIDGLLLQHLLGVPNVPLEQITSSLARLAREYST